MFCVLGSPTPHRRQASRPSIHHGLLLACESELNSHAAAVHIRLANGQPRRDDNRQKPFNESKLDDPGNSRSSSRSHHLYSSLIMSSATIPAHPSTEMVKNPAGSGTGWLRLSSHLKTCRTHPRVLFIAISNFPCNLVNGDILSLSAFCLPCISKRPAPSSSLAASRTSSFHTTLSKKSSTSPNTIPTSDFSHLQPFLV